MPHGAFTRPPKIECTTNRTAPSLIAKLLHHDRPIVGHHPRRRTLLGDVLAERARRRLVAAVVVAQCLLDRCWTSSPLGYFAPERPQPPAQLDRAGRVLAFPEGHARRRAWGRRHDHAIVLDRCHAPGGRAELKHIAHSRLVHELLIQLAERVRSARCTV